MKTRLFSLLLVAILTVPAMAGCRAGQNMESAGSAVEHGMESVGNMLEQMVQTTSAVGSTPSANPTLTSEEAQNIALKHAGLTADQVTALHTQYEIERGIPQYDVEFRQGNWEYDYEIHADTGEILSFSKDD